MGVVDDRDWRWGHRMSDVLMQIYQRLPGSFRSIPASLHGLRLRSSRYGPETDTLVNQALEREHWSPEQWKAWQEDRLGFVLNRAASSVPFYRELWADRFRRGDRTSAEELANWPILEKETLRKNPRAFVAEDCELSRMQHVRTSGTTGKSLELWRSQETERAWYALFEARCRQWYGLTRHDRWAILGGRLVTPVHLRRPPFWVWNAALNQLYMSSYHLAPDLVSHYLEALSHYRIKYLYGYTSALYELAQGVLSQGQSKLKVAVVLTNAEPVFGYQREVIEEAFQCPVRETYGMAEVVAAASECENGRMHLWPEVAEVEVVENNRTVNEDASGDLLCTGLLNSDMPLIRYRVGDRVSLAKANEACSCGRTLPILSAIEGRIDDVLYTSDGRRVGRLDPVFKINLPIREAQIIQETLHRVRVCYVPHGEFTGAAARSITRQLQARLGKVQVDFEPVNEVPRTANGKFRAVVCNLTPELKESLRRRLAS